MTHLCIIYAFFGEVMPLFTFEKSQCYYLLVDVGSSFGYIKRGGKVSMKVWNIPFSWKMYLSKW